MSNLKRIKPITRSQEEAFEAWKQGGHLILDGWAGTGKTFIASYLGFSPPKSKVTYVRSCVPTRDIGHLPGTYEEKTAIYELPYIQIAAELFKDPKAYERLKDDKQVEFLTTSYMRGITLKDSVIIVDEAQNLTIDEIDTIITRMGDGARIIFCGDTYQCDFNVAGKKKEMSGFEELIYTAKDMSEFTRIRFKQEDIVRSDIVKTWIIRRHGK